MSMNSTSMQLKNKCKNKKLQQHLRMMRQKQASQHSSTRRGQPYAANGQKTRD